jgi:hypothetical protein
MKRWIIALLTLAICLVLAFLFGRVTAPEPEIVADTITNTITDWQHDTVYRYDTRVVRLPIHDTNTLTDSVWLTDSVIVQVPIYKYCYDTTFTDINSTIRLQATLSGYDVTIDTLAMTTTITPIIIKETIPWQKRFRPSVGVGIGSNFKGEAAIGVFVGIGYLF